MNDYKEEIQKANVSSIDYLDHYITTIDDDAEGLTVLDNGDWIIIF